MKTVNVEDKDRATTPLNSGSPPIDNPLGSDPLGYDVVRLRSTAALLRPILPPDYPWITGMVTDQRNRDVVPAALWEAELTPAMDFVYQGTICNFVITEPTNEIRLGAIGVTTGNFGAQTGTLRLLLDPDFPDDPAIPEGIRLFLQYVFTGWNFRKLHVRGAEGTQPLEAFRKALTLDNTPVFVEEGRLRDHFVRESGFADLVTISLFRPAWEQQLATLLPSPVA